MRICPVQHGRLARARSCGPLNNDRISLVTHSHALKRNPLQKARKAKVASAHSNPGLSSSCSLPARFDQETSEASDASGGTELQSLKNPRGDPQPWNPSFDVRGTGRGHGKNQPFSDSPMRKLPGHKNFNWDAFGGSIIHTHQPF